MKRGRPGLGAGEGRDGAVIRARVTRAQKKQIERFCRVNHVSEAELVRGALESTMGERLKRAVERPGGDK